MVLPIDQWALRYIVFICTDRWLITPFYVAICCFGFTWPGSPLPNFSGYQQGPGLAGLILLRLWISYHVLFHGTVMTILARTSAEIISNLRPFVVYTLSEAVRLAVILVVAVITIIAYPTHFGLFLALQIPTSALGICLAVSGFKLRVNLERSIIREPPADFEPFTDFEDRPLNEAHQLLEEQRAPLCQATAEAPRQADSFCDQDSSLLQVSRGKGKQRAEISNVEDDALSAAYQLQEEQRAQSGQNAADAPEHSDSLYDQEIVSPSGQKPRFNSKQRAEPLNDSGHATAGLRGSPEPGVSATAGKLKHSEGGASLDMAAAGPSREQYESSMPPTSNAATQDAAGAYQTLNRPPLRRESSFTINHKYTGFLHQDANHQLSGLTGIEIFYANAFAVVCQFLIASFRVRWVLQSKANVSW